MSEFGPNLSSKLRQRNQRIRFRIAFACELAELYRKEKIQRIHALTRDANRMLESICRKCMSMRGMKCSKLSKGYPIINSSFHTLEK